MNLSHLTTAESSEDCSVDAEQESDVNQDSEDIFFPVSMLNHKRFILYVFISPETAFPDFLHTKKYIYIKSDSLIHQENIFATIVKRDKGWKRSRVTKHETT